MKQKIVVCLLIIAAFFQNSTLQAQGWEKTYKSPFGDTTSLNNVVETSDSGFVFSGVYYIYRGFALVGFRPFVSKIDKRGNTVWTYNSNSNLMSNIWGTQLTKTTDDGFMLLTTNDNRVMLDLPSVAVIKLNSNGVEQSTKYYLRRNYCSKIAVTAELDKIIVTGFQFKDSAANIVQGTNMLQLSVNGDSIGNHFFKDTSFTSIIFGGDRQIYTAFQSNDSAKIIKYTTGGEKLGTSPIFWANGVLTNLKRANDGRVLANSYLKLDYDGRILFNGRQSMALNIPNKLLTSYIFTQKKSDNNIYLLSDFNPIAPTDENSPFHFVKKDSLGGQLLWRKYIGDITNINHYNLISDMIPTLDGGFLFIGTAEVDNTFRGRIIKTNAEGIVYSNILKGKIHIDSIQNCRQDASEKGFPNRLVAFEKNNETRWAITDSTGNYETQIDTGNYTVRGILPNANWRFCTPSVSKQFLVFGTTDTANFSAQALVNCPQMRISTSTSGLRRCFDNNFYYLRYTNEGTQAAQNAYITLKLDSLLEYISATRPLSSRQGQTLRFDLGNVPIGFEGQFSVQVRVKCGDSTRLGQSLCTEARIFPDTICIPAPNWSGANIIVSGRCDRDSVRFLIQNTGTATSAPLRRKIVEDEIVFLNGLISVPTNGSQTISVPANGKTWQLLMEQEPNNPLSNHPTAVVEGCRLNQNLPISTGFVNLFPTDDGSPTIDNVCAQIVGSFDPNDKEGLPLGYKSAHFIDQNQDIEYRIRFQNTGTDTAFTIVVRDTLSDFLDIASLKIGASSHRFNWTIDGKNVLVFRFENILLPDSFRNEAASHGFVKFKISQKKDVALGTKINNQADIYFDFNSPIRTNKTVHTIGKDFIITALQTVSSLPNVEIKVYPNPFNAEATIDIQGFDPLPDGIGISYLNSKTSNFQLFDALGRQIRSEKFEGNQFLFERQELPTGIYFFKIENGGRLVGTGKFLVK